MHKSKIFPDRVLILGNSGSGKTTLAKYLGGRFLSPVYYLDDEYFLEDWKTTPPDIWHRRIVEITKENRWIIEGNFLPTLPERLKRAELVILLDIPTLKCLSRIILRDLSRYRGKRDTLPERIRKQKHLPKAGEGFLKFWWFVFKYPFSRRSDVLRMTANSGVPTVQFKSSRALKDWLGSGLIART